MRYEGDMESHNPDFDMTTADDDAVKVTRFLFLQSPVSELND